MQLNDKNTHDILPIQVVITSKSFKNQIYDNDRDGKDVWLKRISISLPQRSAIIGI